MAKGYRPVLRDQRFLLPAGHAGVASQPITWCGSCWTPWRRWTLSGAGTGLAAAAGPALRAIDPRMLLGLLMYAYCRGVRSSRQIERLCGTDVAFRVLCAQDVPDHCTIARFRG